MSAILVGWTAASSAPPATELHVRLSDDGPCAPIGEDSANTVVVPLSADGKLDAEINAGSFTADGTPITQVRGVILGFYN